MSRLAIVIALVCARVSPFSDNSEQSSLSAEKNRNDDSKSYHAKEETYKFQLRFTMSPKIDKIAKGARDAESSYESIENAKDRINMAYLDNISHKSLNKTILKEVWRGCNKKGYKSCKKACYSSHKSVCREHSCTSSMKRAFERKCKSNCKDRFDVDSYFSWYDYY